MPLGFESLPSTMLMCLLPARRRQMQNTVVKVNIIRARIVTPIPIPAFSAVVRLFEFVFDPAVEEADEVGALVTFAVEAGDAPDVDVDTAFD